MAELDADHEPDTDELDTIADRKVSGLLRLMDALCENSTSSPRHSSPAWHTGTGPKSTTRYRRR